MLLIHCPYCEASARSSSSATPARRTSPARPIPSALSDEEWRNYLFIRTNPKGLHFERWRHVHGCGRFFNAVRDTVSDKFVLTYKDRASRARVDAEIEAAAGSKEARP